MLNRDGDLRDDGMPDFVVSTSEGTVEVVWSFWDGNDYEVAHSVWLQGSWSVVELLTDNAVDDLEPRLAIVDGGGLSVTWWRDEPTALVMLVERPAGQGTFGPETVISGGNEPAYGPDIASAQGSRYLGYETVSGGSKSITLETSVAGGPFVPEVIASTTRLQDVDVQVHSDGPFTWVLWIDSDEHLGWSERTVGGWTSPDYEPYAGEADLERARLRVKHHVLH
jgi:hypothetical protein